MGYTRLGIRVPTIAVSPWIQKGTLVHEAPTSQKPTATSEYELCSVPATLRALFPQLGPPLNQRDSWAATFENLISHNLRKDCLKELPKVPLPSDTERDRQLLRPIDEHAQGVIRMLCGLNGDEESCGQHIKTYFYYASWIGPQWSTWMRG